MPHANPSYEFKLTRLGKLQKQKLEIFKTRRRRRGRGIPLPPWRQTVDRYLTFVIETKTVIQHPDDILEPVQKAMHASQLDPNTVANNLRVKPLFPSADPNDNITRLAHYYLLEIPISFNKFFQKVKKRFGVFWDLAYQIQQIGQQEFVYVEPDIPAKFYMRPLQSHIPGCTVGPEAAPQSVDWARDLVRLENIPTDITGEGVLIGHIDTGHTDHPELNRHVCFDLSRDKDVIKNDDNATDPMPHGSSHGTSTASIICSQHGTFWEDVNGNHKPGINGVAPDCTIVSVRAIEEVVAIFNTDVAQAVWHCIQEKVHIITMSLGGYANPWLQAVIAHAVYRENIIVTAAAGNCWPYVVFPAAYPEVIACGGVGLHPTTGSTRIWKGSAEGKAVDISAPAENVYVADFDVMGRPVVQPGEGTSFATPHVAGIAALWLQKHGRTRLIEEIYAGSNANLCEVFRYIIQKTAQTGPGWDKNRNGAGIIDSVAVLDQDLPDSDLFKKSIAQWRHMTALEILYLIFDLSEQAKDIVYEMIKEIISSSVITVEEFLEKFGQEFNQLAAQNETAWQDLSDGLEAMAQKIVAETSDAAEIVGETVEDFVDDVADAVSDTVSTVAGWFGD